MASSKSDASKKSEAKSGASGTPSAPNARKTGAPRSSTSARHNPQQFYALVRRPIVTEKSTTMQSLRNQFTFEVARTANKIEVKKAIETLFSVNVLKVNIVGVPSKARRTFGRPGESKPWKKAIVTLREGESIDIS